MNTTKLQYNIDELKEEISVFYEEIENLKNSLSDLNETYNYKSFNKNITKQLRKKKKTNKLDSTTTALTVVNTGKLANISDKTKKAAKFSLKSIFVSLAMTFLNFFI